MLQCHGWLQFIPFLLCTTIIVIIVNLIHSVTLVGVVDSLDVWYEDK